MSTASVSGSTDLRSRLIEEAARILGEEGPSALSARRLATAAGTSTMAVYTHFGSMAGVADAVASEGFRRLIDHVAEVRTTDDPIADLRAMTAAYRANALENRHLYLVMFGAVSLGGFGGHGADREVSAEAFGQLVAGIARAMEAGRLRDGDPAAVAAQFWSALHGYVMLELAGMDQVVADPEHSVLWRMLGNLLSALSPPPR